jgi:hypothetical protein
MRITRDTLLKIAQDTVSRQVRANREILAAYLCGSVLNDEFLLGGTADIDLVFVHNDQPPEPREIIRLSDEAHLDIAHHYEREYRQPRHLRADPWLGPTLNACKALYDPRHFLDFTQASVRSQFDRPDTVLQRARSSAGRSRQIWTDLQMLPGEPGAKEFNSYLRAIGHVANAITGLNGPPLTERRFLLGFPARAAALNRPGLYAGLLGLLGAPNISTDTLWGWLAMWQTAYHTLPAEKTPPRLHLDRSAYYHKAFEALLSNPQPQAVLWPLLRTWSLAASLLPPQSDEFRDWHEAVTQAGLLGPNFAERLEALDAYLDLVDETLEEWARANGAGEE